MAAETRKLKQHVPKSIDQEPMESMDFESHHDYLFRTIVSNVRPVPAGTLAYTACCTGTVPQTV